LVLLLFFLTYLIIFSQYLLMI